MASENNLRQLAACLNDASNLVTNIINSSEQQQSSRQGRSSVPSTAENAHQAPRGIPASSISQALSRARSMVRSSSRGGLYSRLGQRERLRATAVSTTGQPDPKKIRRAVESKAFEFVLMKMDDGDAMAVAEENVALRGFIQLSSNDKEVDIRKKIGEALRLKFPCVVDRDFEFLRANRRRLSKPVTCEEYDFKQVKLLAGQGCIYIKIKDGLECFLDGNDGDLGMEDCEGLCFSVVQYFLCSH